MPLAQIILVAVLTPYACLGLYDGYLHDRARKVPKLEQLAHAVLGICMALFLFGVFRQHAILAAIALTVFICVYAVDEFVFHQGIGAHERMVHAAAMSALALFVLTWRWLGA
jgi:hypothetical protein